MENYLINQRDKALMHFVSSKESRGNYDAVYPGDAERPEILEYTINLIIEMQNEMVKSAIAQQYSRSTAVGRYQLTQDQVVTASNYLGINRDLTKFSEAIQDAFFMEIIKKDCDYEKWLADEVETEIFQYKLSGQFESIPLPCSQNNETQRLGRVGSLIAQHDCDTCTDELDDIKKMDPGNTIQIPIQLNTTSGVTPSAGSSYQRIAQTATTGTVVSGGHASLTQTVVNLPEVDNPYLYEPIDPYDDRYDFRTGKKVMDIGINGTDSVNVNSVPIGENFDTPGRQVTQTGGTSGATQTGAAGDGTRGSATSSEVSDEDILFSQPLTASGSQTGSKSLPTPNSGPR